jgi:hypothetical protein
MTPIGDDSEGVIAASLTFLAMTILGCSVATFLAIEAIYV